MALLKGLVSSSVPSSLLFNSTNLSFFSSLFLYPSQSFAPFPCQLVPQLLHWSLSHSGTPDIRHSGRQSSSEISRQAIIEVNPRAPAKKPWICSFALSPCRNSFWNARLAFKSLMCLVKAEIATFCSCFCRVEVLTKLRKPHLVLSWKRIDGSVTSLGESLCAPLNATRLQTSVCNLNLKVLKDQYRVQQEGCENRFWRQLWWITSQFFSILLTDYCLCCVKQMAWQEWTQTCQNDFT